MIPAPRYFLMRLKRYGPLVPARLWWCDHEPGHPENKLDRGLLSVYPAIDIAGEETLPEHLIERLISPYRRGDLVKQPAVLIADLIAAGPDAGVPRTHWKYLQPIGEAEYRHQLRVLRWAETNRREHPVLRPRKAIDPLAMPLPNFDREHSL